MEKVREKFLKHDMRLEEYQREAVLNTLDFLEESLNYEFVQELGRGGYGSVIELKNKRNSSRVGAKIVIEEFVSQSEKDLWPYLTHENILPLINVEYIATTYSYIFITPLHPTSLCNVLQTSDLAKDRNGIEKVQYWLHGICRGVNYLHEEKLCHLDLKVSNVLISESGTPVICDFGSLTRTDGPTTKYLSPVIYRPPECLDVTTTVNGYSYDIFTLGLLCMELLTKEALLTSKYLQNTIPSWCEMLYPAIFDILKKNNFEYLVKDHFMMSDINRKWLCYARDFIRGCLNVNPFKRPSSNDLLNHRLFKGDRDFKEIKNDIWIFRCEPDEVKFLVTFYAHRNVKLLNVVETSLQSKERHEQDLGENILVNVESELISPELVKARKDSSCKSDEPQFVELQPERRKKLSFSQWISQKKRGFCKALSRLCCCHKNKYTVSST